MEQVANVKPQTHVSETAAPVPVWFDEQKAADRQRRARSLGVRIGHDHACVWPFVPALEFRSSALSFGATPQPQVASTFIEHLEAAVDDYVDR